MLTPEIRDSISRSVLCWLATSSADNIPNVSPKEIFTTFGDSMILIANIASPGSIRNINENKNVCVSFIDFFVQKGFQLKGRAHVVNKDDPGFEDLSAPLRKMAGDKFPVTSVIAITVTSAKPILAPSYIFFPGTSEAGQVSSAMKTYGVKPADKSIS